MSYKTKKTGIAVPEQRASTKRNPLEPPVNTAGRADIFKKRWKKGKV